MSTRLTDGSVSRDYRSILSCCSGRGGSNIRVLAKGDGSVYGYSSYVAVGDSFTEGMNDRLPDGTFRGWADRLAGMLAAGQPEFQYANLAVRGKMLAEIVDEQVPVALEAQP